MNTSDSKYKAIAALEQFIREGRPVKFPVKGTSMLPFIVGDRDCVEFYPVEGELKVGDIVMARVEEGYPVVHRIVGIEPVAGDASFSADACRIVLTGDGNLGFKEHCLRKDVIAKAHVVIRPDGSRKSLISPSSLRNWHRWQRLRPVRRVLLKIIKLYILLSYKN